MVYGEPSVDKNVLNFNWDTLAKANFSFFHSFSSFFELGWL